MIAATQFINENIYSLKREYGFSLTLFKKISSTIDIESGVVSDTISFRYINKAILLPSTLIRKIFKVEYDIVSRLIIIDLKDLGSFTIEKDDYVIFNSKKYLINEVKTYEFSAVMIRVEESSGNDFKEYFETESTITLVHSALGVK